MIEIIAYEPRHAAAWRALNEAWLTQYFAIEPKDEVVLGNPDKAVLAPGGAIFMAERDGVAVGCVGLMMLDDGGFEVAKMAVDPAVQGSGAGRRLMNACLAHARAAGAPRLYIESNSSLTPALRLYESVGFKYLPPRPTPYARADVWMELQLSPL